MKYLNPFVVLLFFSFFFFFFLVKAATGEILYVHEIMYSWLLFFFPSDQPLFYLCCYSSMLQAWELKIHYKIAPTKTNAKIFSFLFDLITESENTYMFVQTHLSDDLIMTGHFSLILQNFTTGFCIYFQINFCNFFTLQY